MPGMLYIVPLYTDKCGDNICVDSFLAELVVWGHPFTVIRKQKLRPEPSKIYWVIAKGKQGLKAALILQASLRPQVKIICLGKPLGPIKNYAMSSSEIIHPGNLSDVCTIQLPLIRKEAIEHYREREKTGVVHNGEEGNYSVHLIGGDTFIFKYSQIFFDAIEKTVSSKEGRHYLIASRRTTPLILQKLYGISKRQQNCFVLAWDGNDNRYWSTLAKATQCFVAEDSISMVMEAALLEKTLSIVVLPKKRLNFFINRCGLLLTQFLLFMSPFQLFFCDKARFKYIFKKHAQNHKDFHNTIINDRQVIQDFFHKHFSITNEPETDK
jgi:Mitochondrial fission ELM1